MWCDHHTPRKSNSYSLNRIVFRDNRPPEDVKKYCKINSLIITPKLSTLRRIPLDAKL